jgi:hypothetical protein
LADSLVVEDRSTDATAEFALSMCHREKDASMSDFGPIGPEAHIEQRVPTLR